MLEWLAAVTVAELGKLASEQVLNLSKAAMESYVQDFFKDCIQSGVAQANASTLKQPMAEAIGVFIKRFVKELQINDVPDTSIDHYYSAAIKRFVQEKTARPILGKAFEKDCKNIDYQQLEQLWLQTPDLQKWQFPTDEFDWRGVAKEYVFEVKGIIKANPELRAILTTELTEDAANTLKQLAGVSVGFDLSGYRNAILKQYGALQLDSLGSSKYEREGVTYRGMSLWQVFVAQSARECQEYMPQTYEIPKEQLRRMQEAGDVEAIAEAEAELRKARYFERSPRSILDIVGACENLPIAQPTELYLVILGDPGSGKSTILRYLAVNWAQQTSDEQIPLLIELRGYIQSKSQQECRDFVEFVHKGSNWVSHLDQHELDERLTQGKVLVMFDGLDEVSERQQRGTVITQIHSFTQRYPQVPVIVTSRVIGYSAQPLRDAGFQHYMLQDLDREQIPEFIQRWHDLTYEPGHEAEKQRKQKRLSHAIERSKAIQELAGNPLLLTLMAILNRGEELPRDRSRLYEKATEVLLYQWDVEAKLLEDPRIKKYAVELDYRDKQAMLRNVAYAMQTSEKGLSGNFILRADLERCLTNYLKTKKEAQNAPSIAAVIIDQLRERNFILCFLGHSGDTDAYAFMHRTFLEYFCATEIKERFDKRGVEGGITFEQLRDEIFGQHWQDETWHEVLRLVAGLLDAKFTGELIEWLMAQPIDRSEFLDEYCERLEKKGLINLLLAADCLEEVRDRTTIASIATTLLNKLKQDVESESPYKFSREAAEALLKSIAAHWQDDPTIRLWLEQCTRFDSMHVPEFAIEMIAQLGSGQSQTATWLKDRVQHDEDETIRTAAMLALVEYFKDDPDTLPMLKVQVQEHEDFRAMFALVDNFEDDPDTLPILKSQAQPDQREDVRRAAVDALVEWFKDHPDTLSILKTQAQEDEDESVRIHAIEVLAEHFKNKPSVLEVLHQVALTAPFERQYTLQAHPRLLALEAIVAQEPTDPQTFELLRGRATNDLDEQVREWAQEQLNQILAEEG